MAVYSPSRFAEANPAGFDGLFDWDFLRPAWKPTKVQPMDWDAVVERGGHFLVFETKEPGKAMPLGQQITLERAVLTGYVTVFFIHGKTATSVSSLEIWNRRDWRVAKTLFNPCNADLVTSKATKWFKYASANPTSLVAMARAA